MPISLFFLLLACQAGDGTGVRFRNLFHLPSRLSIPLPNSPPPSLREKIAEPANYNALLCIIINSSTLKLTPRQISKGFFVCLFKKGGKHLFSGSFNFSSTHPFIIICHHSGGPPDQIVGNSVCDRGRKGKSRRVIGNQDEHSSCLPPPPSLPKHRSITM